MENPKNKKIVDYLGNHTYGKVSISNPILYVPRNFPHIDDEAFISWALKDYVKRNPIPPPFDFNWKWRKQK
jgi:hypothetical protein